jgi:hypothetical protein
MFEAFAFWITEDGGKFDAEELKSGAKRSSIAERLTG